MSAQVSKKIMIPDVMLLCHFFLRLPHSAQSFKNILSWLVFARHGSYDVSQTGLQACVSNFTQRVNNLVAMFWVCLVESVTKGGHLGIPSELPG